MISRLKYFIRGFWRKPASATYFHPGIKYTEGLRAIHASIQPSSYIEIGVSSGRSFALAGCSAVGIDPEFKIKRNVIGNREKTFLFQMTSDHFFENQDLRQYLPKGVDFAFLDGMHHFEFLLRDFINVEKYSHAGTVIAMHDCHPVNTEITGRIRSRIPRTNYATRHGWAGDVWKLLPILRRYRSGLKIITFDCPPTGLVVVSGLDPRSTELTQAYDAIIKEYDNLTLDAYGFERFREEFPLLDSRRYANAEEMRKLLRPLQSN